MSAKVRMKIHTAAGPACSLCGRGWDCWLAPDEEPCRCRDRRSGCPCEWVEPCHPDCSCTSPHMSRACRRCCSAGSDEQRIAMASHLARVIADSDSVLWTYCVDAQPTEKRWYRVARHCLQTDGRVRNVNAYTSQAHYLGGQWYDAGGGRIDWSVYAWREMEEPPEFRPEDWNPESQ